jgi:DNA polymerase I
LGRVFVLDAMALAYRAYYAFIRRPLVNSRGENTSALFGFANSALKVRAEEHPDYWALAWDGPGPTFRHERYPEYKATRKPMPEDLLSQIPALEDLAHALGLPILEVPGAEADDVMATLATRAEHDGHEAVLVTGDKDMLQLVTDHVRVLSPVSREDYAWIGRDEVHEKWGVAPEQLRDVLALMGDSTDNVPGVPGVGPKTARELIQQFGSLDALYARLGEVARESLRAKLAANKDKALLSRELVTVKTDLDLPVTWDQIRCGPIRREALLAFARRHEIVRLERVAHQSGVSDAEAGPAAPGRDPTRRGTAAEMRGTGVRLAGEPDPTPARPGPVRSDPRSGRPASPAPDSEPPVDVSRPVSAPWSEPRDRAATATPPVASDPSTTPAVGVMHPAPPLPVRQGTLDLWDVSDVSASTTTAAGSVREALEERLHAVRARAIHGLSVLPLLDGEDARRDPLIGVALAASDGTSCYVPMAHADGPCFSVDQVREWLAPALFDTSVPKTALDLKIASHVFSRLGMPLRGGTFDLHLGSFVCDPERRHDLTALARDVLGIVLPPLTPEAARGKARASLSSIEAVEAAPRAAPYAAVMPALASALQAQLASREQVRLYEQIEHPLIEVLVDMERAGIALDVEVLHEMAADAGREIERLEAELYALAGERINLNSGPQLARVMFETLGLQSGRRTKTGFSTDQAVLEELAPTHPFPARLLEYRALAKLKSTYLDALPLAVDPADGRVHTTYHQTGAATGRLSSSAPNLQNIPMRTPQGRAIRRAFVAAPGSLLVGADYSQIELRVMAHLSEDPQLIAAFESGEDVHANTARRIFGVEKGDLDPQLRARAKVVNFGVMYGMGARSLSQQMGIGLSEAREFIAHYFRVYARVREFLDGTIEEARRRGYVQTLLGRRRYLPELEGAGGARRAMAERAAINTPIQGSAADLMKLAMIRVHHALKPHAGSARLLLQVHDELVLECASSEVEAVAGVVRSEMVGCFPLLVPLEVSVGRGPTWYDVHG